MTKPAINQIDPSIAYWHEPRQSPEPEGDLIIDVILRAFKDARGESSGLATKQAKKQSEQQGKEFILDQYEIDWGSAQLTATELCIIATGSDYFIKKLQHAILTNNTQGLGKYKKRVLRLGKRI